MVQNMKWAKKVSKVLCALFTKAIYVNEVLVKVDRVATLHVFDLLLDMEAKVLGYTS